MRKNKIQKEKMRTYVSEKNYQKILRNKYQKILTRMKS